MEDVFGGHQLGEAGRVDQLVGVALVQHAAALRPRSGWRAARRARARLFLGGAFFCAARRAGLGAGFLAFGAATANAPQRDSTAAAVSSPELRQCRSAISNALCRRAQRRARHAASNSGGLAEICGSVKAAAAHEARTRHHSAPGHRRKPATARLRPRGGGKFDAAAGARRRRLVGLRRGGTAPRGRPRPADKAARAASARGAACRVIGRRIEIGRRVRLGGGDLHTGAVACRGRAGWPPACGRRSRPAARGRHIRPSPW